MIPLQTPPAIVLITSNAGSRITLLALSMKERTLPRALANGERLEEAIEAYRAVPAGSGFDWQASYNFV